MSEHPPQWTVRWQIAGGPVHHERFDDIRDAVERWWHRRRWLGREPLLLELLAPDGEVVKSWPESEA